MAGGYFKQVKKGTTNAYTRKQPTYSKTKRFRSSWRRKFQPSTGLKSLTGIGRYLNMVYKAGWKDSVLVANVSNTRLFRMNSVYDPDALAILPPTKNKLCEGMTELATLFNRYCVYGCKVIVTAQNLCDEPIRIVLSPSNSATPYANSTMSSDIASRPGAKSRVAGPAGSSNDKVTLTYFANPRNIIGINKAAYGQDIFSASLNNSPAIAAMLAISYGPLTDTIAEANGSVFFDIRFVYGTRFYDITENLDE